MVSNFIFNNILNLKLTYIAMSPAEVTEKLGLHKMRERRWYVHPSCATTGEGLFEGNYITLISVYESYF